MGGKAFMRSIFSNWLLVGTCGAILCFNIVLYAFFLRPQEENIARLEQRYSRVRKGQVVKGRDRLERLIREKTELETFLAVLPRKSAFPDVALQVYKMIQKNGLRASRMAFKPQNVGRLSLTKYTTSFKLTGTYGQIKRFLVDLLDSKNLFCIEGLSLERGQKNERKVVMNLKLSLYFTP
ncbi:MAG: type 4a pilus biogenesis protein PilO [Deltaproteobacteria bacterium]|nr:type 4a pilus biogenesis protein PilO [Deltaproteobacteria bacterium]MBW1929388.1 type 4a pilus biogenesis protein PilO [Deltaproteobacteria bacterium]MBW2126706.1 type 4a pilus biogenesis protein PilO [Deltaproteobacteria bacterium]